MVKPIEVFREAIYSKTEISRSRLSLIEKLTESPEQSSVRSEQVILPYSPDLLKLSQHIWSSHLLAYRFKKAIMFHEIAPFHSKSGGHAELPEDHCEELETPEHKLQEEETSEAYDN